MGKSYTPKYRLETPGFTHMCWNSKQDGRPTIENLRKYRDQMEKSFLPGGVNEHLGIRKMGPCRIVNQFTRETVAELKE